MSEWISVKERMPEDGKVAETKIHDQRGQRNYQRLKRMGRLWFLPNGGIYVYYTPTLWRPTPPGEEET